MVLKEGLKDHILFLGRRDDIYHMYQAFDLFILPSSYEGLPTAGIEAQTSGLKCIFSNNITKEVDITGNCEFLELNEEIWVSKIQELRNKKEERKNLENKILEAGYDINSTIQKLERIYVEGER